MKHFLLMFLFVIVGSAASAQTSPRYVVTDLNGKLSPSTASAYAINDKIEIVGVIDGRPFLWRKGTLTMLNFNGVPTAINNRSQIVGTLNIQGSNVEAWKPDMRGFLYQKGMVQNLGVLPGGVFSSSARAISAGGKIVGYSATSRFNHAFLYQQGKMLDLGVPAHYDSSAAAGVNSVGQVVAWARCMSPPYTKVGFLWQSGKWRRLSANIAPIAINDNGDVLEEKSLSNAKHTATITTCLLWKDGFQRSIGKFHPKAVNNRGEVVGSIIPDMDAPPPVPRYGNPLYFQPPVRSHPSIAVLWKSGHLYRLNTLLLKSQGWQIVSAEAINNRGEIVGMGIHNGKVCAVLLRPITK